MYVPFSARSFWAFLLLIRFSAVTSGEWFRIEVGNGGSLPSLLRIFDPSSEPQSYRSSVPAFAYLIEFCL